MLNRRTLGRTGFEVAEISFGAWQIGGRGYGQVSEAAAHATISAYLEQGGNFIDTARRYGQSERVLGDYFQQHGGREKIFIASKTHRLEAEAIRAELAESLRQLRTDYLDLYYLHAPPEDPEQMNGALDTYDQLRKEGRIRAIGAASLPPLAITLRQRLEEMYRGRDSAFNTGE